MKKRTCAKKSTSRRATSSSVEASTISSSGRTESRGSSAISLDVGKVTVTGTEVLIALELLCLNFKPRGIEGAKRLETLGDFFNKLNNA